MLDTAEGKKALLDRTIVSVGNYKSGEHNQDARIYDELNTLSLSDALQNSRSVATKDAKSKRRSAEEGRPPSVEDGEITEEKSTTTAPGAARTVISAPSAAQILSPSKPQEAQIPPWRKPTISAPQSGQNSGASSPRATIHRGVPPVYRPNAPVENIPPRNLTRLPLPISIPPHRSNSPTRTLTPGFPFTWDFEQRRSTQQQTSQLERLRTRVTMFESPRDPPEYLNLAQFWPDEGHMEDGASWREWHLDARRPRGNHQAPYALSDRTRQTGPQRTGTTAVPTQARNNPNLWHNRPLPVPLPPTAPRSPNYLVPGSIIWAMYQNIIRQHRDHNLFTSQQRFETELTSTAGQRTQFIWARAVEADRSRTPIPEIDWNLHFSRNGDFVPSLSRDRFFTTPEWIEGHGHGIITTAHNNYHCCYRDQILRLVREFLFHCFHLLLSSEEQGRIISEDLTLWVDTAQILSSSLPDEWTPWTQWLRAMSPAIDRLTAEGSVRFDANLPFGHLARGSNTVPNPMLTWGIGVYYLRRGLRNAAYNPIPNTPGIIQLGERIRDIHWLSILLAWDITNEAFSASRRGLETALGHEIEIDDRGYLILDQITRMGLSPRMILLHPPADIPPSAIPYLHQYQFLRGRIDGVTGMLKLDVSATTAHEPVRLLIRHAQETRADCALLAAIFIRAGIRLNDIIWTRLRAFDQFSTRAEFPLPQPASFAHLIMRQRPVIREASVYSTLVSPPLVPQPDPNSAIFDTLVANFLDELNPEETFDDLEARLRRERDDDDTGPGAGDQDMSHYIGVFSFPSSVPETRTPEPGQQNCQFINLTTIDADNSDVAFFQKWFRNRDALLTVEKVSSIPSKANTRQLALKDLLPKDNNRVNPVEDRANTEPPVAFNLNNATAAEQWGELCGRYRITYDLRQVNSCLVEPQYPFPDFEDIYTYLRGAQFFGVFDFVDGYTQCSLHPDSREYFSILTRFGIYTPTRVPQGASCSPGYFQSTMEAAFAPLLRQGVLVYLDDVLIYAETELEFLNRVLQFLQICRQRDIKVSIRKSTFFAREIEWCGRLITPDGVTHLPDRISGLANLSLPMWGAELYKFLSAANWMRNHIPRFTQITEILYDCMDAVK
eukprot:GHVU01165118.1.p1 GENE.GHVU01165118.1~~GHVU01165118.1.p1  ORF type:complete len:1157 (-),score=88.35 GHVU01165118.1:2617-5970(-)